LFKTARHSSGVLWSGYEDAILDDEDDDGEPNKLPMNGNGIEALSGVAALDG